MNTHSTATLIIAGILIASGALPARAGDPMPPRLDWGLQLGTAENDFGNDVAADPLGVYVVGSSSGSLGAPNPSTNPDAFLLRYDRSGNRLWGRHLGDVFSDHAFGVFANPADGGAYLTGSTSSDLDGTNRGGTDLFLARFDPAGNRLWTRQLGTSINDAGLSVAADPSGSVFVAGQTFGSIAATNNGINKTDAVLSRYDQDGNLLWTRQWGHEDDDTASAVTPDGRGGAFVAGSTRTFLGPTQTGFDAFIRHYDRDGILTWTRTLGQQFNDTATGIAPDGQGGIYISGTTDNSLHGTNPTPVIGDPYLARYDADGQLLWIRQINSPGADSGASVTSDGFGGAILTGSVIQALPGQTALGLGDAFFAHYDNAGNLLYTHQFGSDKADDASDVVADGLGSLYVSGSSWGNVFGPNQGGPYDAFLARFTVVPEPAAYSLLLGAVALSRRWR